MLQFGAFAECTERTEIVCKAKVWQEQGSLP